MRSIAVVVLIGLVLCGCAAPEPSAPAPARAPGPRLPASALPVPLVRQANTYSCGAAVLLSLLYYWSADDCGEHALYKALDTTEADGTDPKKIAEVARAKGLEARIVEGLAIADLRAALARGDTAVLDLQAWREEAKKPWKDEWEEGHYVILVGLDEQFLYAMDPSVGAGYAYLPIAEFVDRWHDYENRTGTVKRYVHAAIIVRGKKPLTTIPAPLTRME